MKIKTIHFLLFLLSLSMLAYFFRSNIYNYYDSLVWKIKDKQYENEIISVFEEVFGKAYRQKFSQLGVSYPPGEIILVGIKKDHVLELWAGDERENYKLIHNSNDFLSGRFRESSPLPPEKVPEGVFSLATLKPPHQHLLILQDWPDSQKEILIKFFKLLQKVCFDVEYSICSSAVIIWGIDMPDIGIDLFIHDIGEENVTIIISPVDFRKENPLKFMDSQPECATERYQSIEKALSKLK